VVGNVKLAAATVRGHIVDTMALGAAPLPGFAPPSGRLSRRH
jgi:hypothetical protein